MEALSKSSSSSSVFVSKFPETQSSVVGVGVIHHPLKTLLLKRGQQQQQQRIITPYLKINSSSSACELRLFALSRPVSDEGFSEEEQDSSSSSSSFDNNNGFALLSPHISSFSQVGRVTYPINILSFIFFFDFIYVYTMLVVYILLLLLRIVIVFVILFEDTHPNKIN